jgi:hypothetical protein
MASRFDIALKKAPKKSIQKIVRKPKTEHRSENLSMSQGLKLVNEGTGQELSLRTADLNFSISSTSEGLQIATITVVLTCAIEEAQQLFTLPQ